MAPDWATPSMVGPDKAVPRTPPRLSCSLRWQPRPKRKREPLGGCTSRFNPLKKPQHPVARAYITLFGAVGCLYGADGPYRVACVLKNERF